MIYADYSDTEFFYLDNPKSICNTKELLIGAGEYIKDVQVVK